MAVVQRLPVGGSGETVPGNAGRRRGHPSGRDRDVRLVHAARRRRRRTAPVPGPSQQVAGATFLLEAHVRHGRKEGFGVPGLEQPVQGERQFQFHVPECVPERVHQGRPAGR